MNASANGAVATAPPTAGATSERPPLRSSRSPWLAVAAAATAVAGGLHLVAGAQHVDAGDLVVAFFVLTGFGQLTAAVALLVPLSGPAAARTRALLALAGLVATAALVTLYVVAHTTDLLAGLLEHPEAAGHGHAAVAGSPVLPAEPVSPGGPAAAPEPVDGLGTATVAAELLALCGFLALLPALWRRRAANALLLLGGLAWVSWLSGSLA